MKSKKKMRPDGRLIGWTETSSLAIKPPNTLRTIGNATAAKPSTSPALIEEASRRSSFAWFSKSTAMLFLVLSLSRPSKRPVFSHLLRRAAPSAERSRLTISLVKLSTIVDIIYPPMNVTCQYPLNASYD